MYFMKNNSHSMTWNIRVQFPKWHVTLRFTGHHYFINALKPTIDNSALLLLSMVIISENGET